MLHTKHRPKTLDEVIGLRGIVESLRGALKKSPEERPHSFMFHGQYGRGKTTLARILGTALNCGNNVIEINAASSRGIDMARDIERGANYAPMGSEAKIYILDEAHQLTTEAQNTLLNVTEHPPTFCYFVFCTTEPKKVRATLRDRCQVYEVSPLTTSEMKELLTRVYKAEDLKFSKEVGLEIIKVAEGSPRTALVAMEKASQIEDEDLLLEILRSGLVEAPAAVIDLCRYLVRQEPPEWKTINDMLDNIETEPESIRIAILNYLSSCLKGARTKGLLTYYLTLMEFFGTELGSRTPKAELRYALGLLASYRMKD